MCEWHDSLQDKDELDADDKELLDGFMKNLKRFFPVILPARRGNDTLRIP
jgi:hypothetical protein